LVPCPATGVVNIADMVGDDEEDTSLLRKLGERARSYLSDFSWCASIVEMYYGLGIGGIAGVFLCRIVPTEARVDEWLWVIVGDLPSAYLVLDSAENPVDAMRAYVAEMNKWVELAKLGKTSEQVIPVNTPATPEYAAKLETRLHLLDILVIPKFVSASEHY
jgi:hypothetical protein